MKNDPKFSRRLAAIPSLYGIPLNEVARKARMQPQSVRRIAAGVGAYWLERSMIKLVPVVDHIYATGKVIGSAKEVTFDTEPITRRQPDPSSGSVCFLLGVVITIVLSWWLGFYQADVQHETYYVNTCVVSESASGSASAPPSSATDDSLDLGDCGSPSVGGSCDDEY